jgi:D-alanyl-D-alanine carboxypeptidase
VQVRDSGASTPENHPVLLFVATLAMAQVDGGSLDAGSAPLAQSADGGQPPRGLACLTHWYAGTVKWKPDAGWGIDLANGVFLRWTSEHPREEDEDAVPLAPNLEDIYRPPYRPGPIVPVDTADAGKIDDPGRVRVEQLLLATYGANREEVVNHLGRVRFFGIRWPFHELAAPALDRVVARLTAQLKTDKKLLPFLQDIGGTWIWRKISRSKNLSAHAFGIAIDINVERSAYWRWTKRGEPIIWQNKIPQAIVDAFEAEGFIWGGRWVHYDTMHFEYRPELLSAECREPGDADP